MRTLKLTIAYDGTAYAGWQFQPDQPTVQERSKTPSPKSPASRIRVLASGRTDAGVHALGQVVGFRTDSPLPPEVLLRAINANLPQDVAVLDVAERPRVPSHQPRRPQTLPLHDPRRAGPRRLSPAFRWHYVYGRLDAEAMQRAAAALLGTHDFSSFETSGAERKTSVRTVFDLSVERGRAGADSSGEDGRGAGE